MVKKHTGTIITRFDHLSFSNKQRFTYLGVGSFGAKAQGLASIKDIIEKEIAPRFKSVIRIDIPLLAVITTDYFDEFMIQNNLYHISTSLLPDEQIIHYFQEAKLPARLEEHLRTFLTRVRVPLAIRSSSLLEDAVQEPFAGVYATAMIPNKQPKLEARLHSLTSAIKYIYSSTYFKEARYYLQATNHKLSEEKMAVIIQKVVGAFHGNRFYPHISGVARSFNFYPTGLSQPEDGIISLALGLGKIIVDDGIGWSFSPDYPHVNPPYNTLGDLLEQTQKYFWAIDVKESSESFSVNGTAHLNKYQLSVAEQDGALSLLASTYKTEDDKLSMGIVESGPRIINFAQILKTNQIPLVALLKKLVEKCEDLSGTMVEIEFALTIPHSPKSLPYFGFLQVRPMIVSQSLITVEPEELTGDNVVVASDSTLGNGIDTTIFNIVYVKPQNFSTQHTYAIGLELESINLKLLTEKSPYILIGFGRWGSSDPSAGIPVKFGQISGARVIVESTLPDIDFIPSQGSHFFHNITSFKVLYFPVSHSGRLKIDWAWLEHQETVTESKFIRHIRLAQPLQIKVDGRTRLGVILKGDTSLLPPG